MRFPWRRAAAAGNAADRQVMNLGAVNPAASGHVLMGPARPAASPAGSPAAGYLGGLLPGRRCHEAYVDHVEPQVVDSLNEPGESAPIWQFSPQGCRAMAHHDLAAGDNQRVNLTAQLLGIAQSQAQ